MSEELRVDLPYTSPKALHPSTSHAMRVTADRSTSAFTVSVELWLIGRPRASVSHAVTAPSLSECVQRIHDAIRDAQDDPLDELLRGSAVADHVRDCLDRVLLQGRTGSSGPIAQPAVADQELNRVLVVDPNAPVRDLLNILLDAAGFHVVAVADPGGALTACANECFDVAVVDADGNVEDAARLVQWMRSRRPPVPALVVGTAVRAGEKLAPARILRKPFTRRELITAIRAIVTTSTPSEGQG